MRTSYQNVWDEIYQQGYYTHYPNECIVRFIFKELSHNNKKDIRVLDLGCGTGNNIWMLAKEGFDTYAFDGSSAALELNKKRLTEMQLSAHLSRGDFLYLAYNNDFFDVVIDDAGIEANTFENIPYIFKEVYRVLKKGGTYFGRLISTESKSSMSAGFEIEKNTFTETKGDFLTRKRVIHFFEYEEIRHLTGECGFSNVKIDYIIISNDNSKDFVKFWLLEATK